MRYPRIMFQSLTMDLHGSRVGGVAAVAVGREVAICTSGDAVPAAETGELPEGVGLRIGAC